MESQFGIANVWIQGDIVTRAVALLLLLGYSRVEVREMGLDPDLVAQVDMGEPPAGGDSGVA